jgi:hypothetical protein
VRKGYAQASTSRRFLFFLETVTSVGGGLDLGPSTLKDLTGNNANVYGDMLTPGRPGEETDRVAVSPLGDYVAAVRCIYTGSPYIYLYYSIIPSFGCLTTSNTSTTYYRTQEDLLICATRSTLDLDSSTSGTQSVIFLGTGQQSNNASTTLADMSSSSGYCRGLPYINGGGRRISGVRFAPAVSGAVDSHTVVFLYQGHASYNCKYQGSAYGLSINATTWGTGVYWNMAAQASLRFQFRANDGSAVNVGSGASTWTKNNLAGLSGITTIGNTTAPFNDMSASDQQFWTTFTSQNGSFLYYVSDQQNGRNHMVGINMTNNTIGSRASWTPFSPHAATVGFEQFDCNAWNYSNRFWAVPGGVLYPPSGRTGDGIVFVIGSASSAGALSSLDLDVYAFDSNVGGSFVALTPNITDGTTNAINHLYASADGNFLVGQRTKFGGDGGANRGVFNSQSDLFAVINVHAVLAGTQTPNAFILSAARSHGSTVAFVGENTATGPQAIIYSSDNAGNTDTGNRTWDDRVLKMGLLAPNSPPATVDSTPSHYAVFGGARKLDDDPNSGS